MRSSALCLPTSFTFFRAPFSSDISNSIDSTTASNLFTLIGRPSSSRHWKSRHSCSQSAIASVRYFRRSRTLKDVFGKNWSARVML